ASFNSKDFENACEQIRVHRRQERGQSCVSEWAAEAVAGGDGARDQAERPVLEDKGVHPFVVGEGDDGEADDEGDEHHQNVGLETFWRGFCRHSFLALSAWASRPRDSRRDASATFRRYVFSIDGRLEAGRSSRDTSSPALLDRARQGARRDEGGLPTLRRTLASGAGNLRVENSASRLARSLP